MKRSTVVYRHSDMRAVVVVYARIQRLPRQRSRDSAHCLLLRSSTNQVCDPRDFITIDCIGKPQRYGALVPCAQRILSITVHTVVLLGGLGNTYSKVLQCITSSICTEKVRGNMFLLQGRRMHEESLKLLENATFRKTSKWIRIERQ